MSEQMLRKQIYLPKRQNLALRRLAKERGVSEAEVIRQALERETEVKATAVRSSAGAWAAVLAFVRGRRNSLAAGAKPVQWSRQEIHEERENRWIEPKRGG